MKEFDTKKSRQAQKAFADKMDYPHFAPYSGKCYNCNKDIYSEIDHGTYKTGVDVERAGTTLVTGCPHCNMSYCE